MSFKQLKIKNVSILSFITDIKIGKVFLKSVNIRSVIRNLANKVKSKMLKV
jgi:hypothetical protein